MKKLPLGIQNFREIIEGDYVYIDKTKYIYDLIEGAKFYFLSRPRRFGKSLLLDTIGEVFSGNRELFKGLWIYDSDYAFEPHPIIRLDMSNISNKSPEILENSILAALGEYIKKEGIETTAKNPGDVFKRLITDLHKKYNQQVVVLIDEYDKPILDHLHAPDMAEANRAVLRGFYGILKSMDPYLCFTMITGVSKFTKTSIFSELNNLLDITLFKDYSGICGIPVGELDLHFSPHIKNLRTKRAFLYVESIHDKILEWYDGYSWDGYNRVLNPFSLLTFFLRKEFESFWYSSGSPKFLIDMIKGKPESFLSLNSMRITESMLDNFDIRNMALEPLLFQTGYLTVKDISYKHLPPRYTLEMPNLEVSEAFNTQVLAALTENGEVQVGNASMDIADALEEGNLQRVLDLLKGLFASIPYQLHGKDEAYYHSIFYAVMTVLGFDMDAEVSSYRGRVDAVLELNDKVYVMEFKYASCEPEASVEEKRELFEKELDEAMSQIAKQGYSDKYKGSGKAIYHVAFAFLGRDNIEMRLSKASE